MGWGGEVYIYGIWGCARDSGFAPPGSCAVPLLPHAPGARRGATTLFLKAKRHHHSAILFLNSNTYCNTTMDYLAIVTFSAGCLPVAAGYSFIFLVLVILHLPARYVAVGTMQTGSPALASALSPSRFLLCYGNSFRFMLWFSAGIKAMLV